MERCETPWTTHNWSTNRTSYLTRILESIERVSRCSAIRLQLGWKAVRKRSTTPMSSQTKLRSMGRTLGVSLIGLLRVEWWAMERVRLAHWWWLLGRSEGPTRLLVTSLHMIRVINSLTHKTDTRSIAPRTYTAGGVSFNSILIRSTSSIQSSNLLSRATTSRIEGSGVCVPWHQQHAPLVTPK